MALDAFLWLVLGIALQLQLLVADSTNDNKNAIVQPGGELSDGSNQDDEHSLSKRFTDQDDGYQLADRDDSINGIGLDGLYPLDPYGYFNGYGTDGVDEADFSDNPMDKRHNSRWNLIHRKLAELNRNNKRDYDKRQDSRWLIIQNKLNQLHNGRYSKRGIGRWKNTNWALGQLQDE